VSARVLITATDGAERTVTHVTAVTLKRAAKRAHRASPLLPSWVPLQLWPAA
jgi:hypothetical protein